MYAYLLAAIAGILTGKDGKTLDNKDILQVGLGVTLASFILTYVVSLLGLIPLESMIGYQLVALLGVWSLVIGPAIAAIFSILVYVLVAFVTAIAVRR